MALASDSQAGAEGPAGSRVELRQLRPTVSIHVDIHTVPGHGGFGGLCCFLGDSLDPLSGSV